MESKKAQGAMNDALSNALTTAAPWLAISSASVWAANSYWPAFRKSFGASGKTSLIIMPPIVAYNLAGEASVLRSLRADADGEAVAAPSKRTGMTTGVPAAVSRSMAAAMAVSSGPSRVNAMSNTTARTPIAASLSRRPACSFRSARMSAVAMPTIPMSSAGTT